MISTKLQLFTILLLSFVCFLNARVFTSIKSADSPFQMLSDFGGSSIYSTSANINNSMADLQIFAFTSSFPDTIKSLAGVFDIQFDKGESFAKGLTTGDKYITRFIVINLGSLDNTLAFIIRQSKEEYKKSKLPMSEHLLTNVPSYPGSNPVSFLANEDTSFAMETSEVYASPTAVRNYYVNTMDSLGWATGIPLKNGEKLPAYMAWIKPKKFCSVYANTNPSGKTTVSIIYKELGE